MMGETGRTGGRASLGPWISGLGLSAAILPGLTRAKLDDVAMAIALVVAALVAQLPRQRALAILGVAMAGAGYWLLPQNTFPLTIWLIATVVGAGIGLALPAGPVRRSRWTVVAALTGVVVLLIVRDRAGHDAALVVGFAAVAVMGGWTVAMGAGHRRGPRWLALTSAVLALLLTLGSASWVGASTARVTWFGSLYWHGPAAGDRVALTFDDGPNANDTLKVRDILDEYGVKGTFFTVGKALDARPDISRSLLADGMLLADHSYHHDSTSWLDPRYPEIAMTQRAFKQHLGVCPAFFRPPHGTHTPFMAHAAHERGMTVVTWTVSAGDWATTDGHLVAQRILAGVQPGSIILLHDGLDGNVTADRSVLLTALPLILDGLKARGLHPVTLDKLLDKPGYVPC